MALCQHKQWVDLSGLDRDWSLSYAQRFKSIIDDLPNPRSQFPCILFFLGKRHKVSALRRIFVNNNVTRQQAHGIANLHLDVTSCDTTYPLLFADCNPDAVSVNGIGRWNGCHETKCFRLSSREVASLDSNGVAELVQSRLLFLFTDILCLFADDLGGLRGITRRLGRWCDLGSSSTSLLPRVLIFTSESSDETGAQHLLSLNSSPAFQKCFSSLTIIKIHQHQLSPEAASARLKAALMSSVDRARETRTESMAMFSAAHVGAFFELALNNFARNPLASFDFLAASRHETNHLEGLPIHVDRFFTLATQNALPRTAAEDFVASAILMDSQPPNMHYFAPAVVFDQLYRGHLLRLKNSEAAAACERIGLAFIRMANEEQEGETSSEYRSAHLASFAQYWALLKTTNTCLFCLCRKPEHVLACGHAICDNCVCIFGISRLGYRYCLPTCALCLAKVDFVLENKPPTAKPRMLSIDGGGIKGVVALTLLCGLQQQLGDCLPLQDYFDLIVGTSSGAFIVLELFVFRSAVGASVEKFIRLAQQIFSAQPSRGKSICARLRRLLCWWLNDSRYADSVLEECLQEAFGTHRRLFDVSAVSGTKIGVMTTSVSDAKLCIFSNYNGAGNRRVKAGYRHLRPERSVDEAFIWETARCTSAAPGYFRPKFLPAFGAFQDGGMRANNPVDAGLWEIGVIWPSTRKPDLVLSVGTGFIEAPESPAVNFLQGILTDGMIPRLFRSFMSSPSVDSENSWEMCMNRLSSEEHADFFRLNMPIEGKEVELDDVDQLGRLQAMGKEYLNAQSVCSGVVEALWASVFYFELDKVAEHRYGNYVCHGSILSRTATCLPLIQTISRRFSAPTFTFCSDVLLGELSEEDCCQSCGFYRLPVIFEVRHMTELVTISLQFNKCVQRRISGFPNPILWFEDQQGLNRVFGCTDHQPDFTIQKCKCTRKGKKRRRISEHSARSSKRARPIS